MEDETAASAPFDLRYVYVCGGVPDGIGPCTACGSGCTTNRGAKSCAASSGCSWWGCWQDPAASPGDYVRRFLGKCERATPPQIPMFTYYQILQASGVGEGAPLVTEAVTDQSLMARYFADWRFFLELIGQTVAIVQIEPDFWGFAQQHRLNPHSEPAAVASADPIDCAAFENSIAGMGQCMIAMARRYAPHVLVGLHASAWSTNVDVSLNARSGLDVSAHAARTAAFLAACGESSADLVFVETCDHDAGYFQVVANRNLWWDATNATLPNFHQHFAWVKALTEALHRPALYWQTPLGNANMNNTTTHYKDNRVDYFLGHMGELAGAHAIGVAFGAGGPNTTPETDGQNLVTKARIYFASAGGGQRLCP